VTIVDDRPFARLEALVPHGEPLALRRGDVLVRQGEPSDTLYFVVSGRFSVQVDGAPRPIAEIGQGQPIGEIGFFAGLPRTATVTALRDASVVGFTREQFDRASDSVPGLRDAVIVALARRISHANRPSRPRPPVRTFAVLPAGGTTIPAPFVAALRREFGAAGVTAFLDAADVARRFPGRAPEDAAVADWLNSLEAAFECVCYLADHEATEWTRKCVRQADAVLLVAAEGAATTPNPGERYAFDVHGARARQLVVLHPRRTPTVTGTAAWLAERDVHVHHHVSLEDAADVQRLQRFVSGRAVGFVAGGGGAYGCAHIGVYQAFVDAGAEFDLLGGTSVGAAMTAGLVTGLTPEGVDAATHDIFIRRRSFHRPTVPRYGLLDHTVFDRALQATYGDVVIEDCWKPFVAVSTNLTDQRLHVHRRGPVWQAVRASSSLPGVLPPFFTSAGEMLVDGGLMDNVPLRPVKAIKTGPNVAVALTLRARTTYQVDYARIPGCRQLVTAVLNPFSRRLPKVPGIVQVIALSMLASRADLQAADSDVVITPEFGRDIGFMSWDRHTDVLRAARHETAATIGRRLAAADAALAAVLRRDQSTREP
jgi:NTE family protein